MLLGRDTERRRIGMIGAAAATGDGQALILLGPPGVGKSALLELAAATAPDGMRILRATGVEAEIELPFAGLGQLLEPLVGELEALPAGARHALMRALALEAGPVADRFGAFVGLRELLTGHARSEPLLIVIDDAQWLDGSTVEALGFVARRLAGTPIGVLVAVRAGEPPAALTRIPVHALAGLAEADSRTLLADWTLAEPVIARLLTAAEGNPLALGELPRELSAEQRAGREPLAEPLPAGGRLGTIFVAKAALLPEATRAALLRLSAAEAPSGGVDRDLALEPAAALGLLVGAPSGAFRFAHPLVRSAVYWGASAAQRREAHDELARLTHGDASTWHRAASVTIPDGEIAGALAATAQRAERRGALQEAVRAYARAADLSPPGAERRRRLADTARTAILAARLDVAGPAAAALRAQAQGPGERAEAAMHAAAIELLGGQPLKAHGLLVAEAGRLETAEPLIAAALLCASSVGLMAAGDVAALRACAERATVLVDGAEAAFTLIPTVLMAEAHIGAGDHDRARDLLSDRHDELLAAGADAGLLHEIVVVAALCWQTMVDFGRAEALVSALIDAARDAATPRVLPFPLAVLGTIEMRRGRWTISRGLLTEALALAEETGPPFVEAFALSALANLDAYEGDESACRRNLARARTTETTYGLTSTGAFRESVLALLELGLGRNAEALEHLELCAGHLRSFGMEDPGWVSGAAELVEVRFAVGPPALAHAELERFARRARQTPSPFATPMLARLEGLAGTDAELDNHFERALAAHATASLPFDEARTRLAYGRRLRRARRRTDARKELGSAREAFERLGAAPWARMAAEELAAAGSRRPLPGDPTAADALTAQETRVARLVAEGATNREVADQLVVSVRTVEHHLRQTYRKLGLRSRTELGHRLRERG